MFRMSKKTEYALLAVQYIAKNGDRIISTKEISEQLNIPYDFLSKTLQQLLKKRILKSFQGNQGGYQLKKLPSKTNLNDIMKAVESKKGIVECLDKKQKNCGRVTNCTIQKNMKEINSKLEDMFKRITIADFL